MLLKTLLSVVFSFALLMPTTAFPRAHGTFCAGNDSTAATVRCLNRHLSSAQKRLNKSYEKLSSMLEAENLENLQNLQKEWLAYRDAQCDWDSEQTQVRSLERVNKLSCLARMTEDRADVLAIILADEELEGAQRQFGAFPRWMNVLAKDEPGVFWNYGKRLEADLDCDGDAEMVMTGLRPKELKVASEEETEDKPLPHGLTFILAIAENPPTGRPQVQILPFSIGAEICSASIAVSAQEEAIVEESEEETPEKKSCGAQLTVAAKGCDPVFVVPAGKAYKVKEEDKAEEETPKKKTDKKEK